MYVYLTKKSKNKKTGKIPVTITEIKSCPTSCILKNKGCYAKYGPLGMHWKKIKAKNKHALKWKQFCNEIKKFNDGQIWRHNQAGDLPGLNEKIDAKKMRELVKANKGKKGFTYTHKPVLRTSYALNNRRIIKRSNSNGFTINLSANNIEEADRLIDLNIAPVTTLLPSDSPIKLKTPKRNKVIVCPAEYKDTNCKKCKLCSINNRKIIIGFRAHGTAKNAVNNILRKLK